jgi:hypothetical protein
VSHALEMAINFYHPTHDLFSFSFPQSFTQNFVHPTPFSSVPPPAINNDCSLRQVKNKKCTLGHIAAQWVNYRHWQIFLVNPLSCRASRGIPIDKLNRLV